MEKSPLRTKIGRSKTAGSIKIHKSDYANTLVPEKPLTKVKILIRSNLLKLFILLQHTVLYQILFKISNCAQTQVKCELQGLDSK